MLCSPYIARWSLGLVAVDVMRGLSASISDATEVGNAFTRKMEVISGVSVANKVVVRRRESRRVYKLQTRRSVAARRTGVVRARNWIAG